MILISHLIIPTRPTTLPTAQNIIDSKDNQRTMKLAKECKSINCSRCWICIDNGKASSPNTNRRSAERDGDKKTKRKEKKENKIDIHTIQYNKQLTAQCSPVPSHKFRNWGKILSHVINRKSARPSRGKRQSEPGWFGVGKTTV